MANRNLSNSQRIVSIGDIVADIVIHIPRLPVEADQYQLIEGRSEIEPGGAGNFLIAGARLKMNMNALGVVGDDSFGNRILQIMHDEGVDIHTINRQPEGSTTLVYVLIDHSGKHVFLGEHGCGPSVVLVDEWKNLIDNADAVQIWGYSFQETRLLPIMMETLRYANSKGRLISFDPGPHMAELPFELRKEILKLSHILLLTEDEVGQFFQPDGNSESAHELLAYGPELVCVKRGAGGCTVITRQTTISHPGFLVETLDTTAAGDSFAAAFLYAYLNKWDLTRVAEYANAMGAAKVRKIGSGRQVPTYHEVQQVLKEFESGNNLSK